MTAEHDESGSIRERGEEAIGELAQALLDNPLFSSTLGRALGVGERAATAQRQALGAAGLASAADLQRLETRLRSLSARIETLEDSLDDLSAQLRAAKSSDG